jgi:hypothetical protein
MRGVVGRGLPHERGPGSKRRTKILDGDIEGEVPWRNYRPYPARLTHDYDALVGVVGERVVAAQPPRLLRGQPKAVSPYLDLGRALREGLAVLLRESDRQRFSALLYEVRTAVAEVNPLAERHPPRAFERVPRGTHGGVHILEGAPHHLGQAFAGARAPQLVGVCPIYPLIGNVRTQRLAHIDLPWFARIEGIACGRPDAQRISRRS